jgi:hypothetical protein
MHFTLIPASSENFCVKQIAELVSQFGGLLLVYLSRQLVATGFFPTGDEKIID